MNGGQPQPAPNLWRRLKDNIADVRPSGALLRKLAELERIAREAERAE